MNTLRLPRRSSLPQDKSRLILPSTPNTSKSSLHKHPVSRKHLLNRKPTQLSVFLQCFLSSFNHNYRSLGIRRSLKSCLLSGSLHVINPLTRLRNLSLFRWWSITEILPSSLFQKRMVSVGESWLLGKIQLKTPKQCLRYVILCFILVPQLSTFSTDCLVSGGKNQPLPQCLDV